MIYTHEREDITHITEVVMHCIKTLEKRTYVK